MLRNRGFPEAWSRLCVCQASFLMTFAMVGVPHAGSWQDMIQRRQWQPTPILLPGKSHGRRSLVGCSPWGREELDTTERLHFHFSLSCIGEGNGNLLQCSCLENPRGGGAWWASIYGVAQSQTRLSDFTYNMTWIRLDFKGVNSLVWK